MISDGQGAIVVTGAGGFVGSHLTVSLIGRGFDVVPIARTNEGATAAVPPLIVGDLADPDTLAGLPTRVRCIVHAAANSGRTRDDPHSMFRDNLVATRNVLDFAKRSFCSRIVYLSSVSIHGRVEESVLDATTPVRSPDVYGRTKLEAEQVLASDPEVSVIALRLPGVLGTGAPEHWIGSLAARASRGEPLTCVNPEGLFNNVVDVDDLTTFVADVIEGDSWPCFDAFPLASTYPITVLETLALIRDTFDGRSEIVSLGDRPPRFVIDDSHARREYGYRSSRTTEVIRRFAQGVKLDG